MIADNNNLPTKRDEDGRYFIDRDGSIFRYVLNYLRDKTLNLPDNFNELKQLKHEADFYQIESLTTEIENRINTMNERQKQILDGLYFTLISKLNQGKILTIIGPVKVLRLFRLESVARKFVKTLEPSISCQCNFPNEDKVISCQPWNEFQRQLLAKQARKFGLPTGYWDDYFYLPFEKILNHDEFVAILNKYEAKLLHTNITYERKNYDDITYTLVENWFVPNIAITQYEQYFTNAFNTSSTSNTSSTTAGAGYYSSASMNGVL
ncbi:unnamed protein product [Didymodactylos carnosus]|nr:unnamed protein product [Didymodactylos carnosus]CAF4000621.1 unnamed protein product [Didymodactylos carnosus]